MSEQKEWAVMLRGHGKYSAEEAGSVEFNEGDHPIPVESEEAALNLVAALDLVRLYEVPNFHYGHWVVSREVKRTDWL